MKVCVDLDELWGNVMRLVATGKWVAGLMATIAACPEGDADKAQARYEKVAARIRSWLEGHALPEPAPTAHPLPWSVSDPVPVTVHGEQCMCANIRDGQGNLVAVGMALEDALAVTVAMNNLEKKPKERNER